mmetsp:Transcript_99620/g.278974  ORF Transcript_99620/g.278974 Transcript_99620/m.278974 type:complete len:348 (-) Transcript_99620:1623-2666(-)
MSTVKICVAFEEPGSCTLSMGRKHLRKSGLHSRTSGSLISIVTPYSSVASSSCVARLTCGETYEASILNSEPMAPAMAQPKCKPKPTETRNPGILEVRSGCALISESFRSRVRADTTCTNATTDKSASFRRRRLSKRLNCHTSRKDCPKFLFAAPKCWSTTRWTMSATWLTKTMVLSFSTSVMTLKFRMSQKPKIASTLVPGIFTVTRALESNMFSAMMFTPASPKPRANKEPSLMIVFSKICVSSSTDVAFNLLRLRRSLTLLGGALSPFSPSRVASNGSLRMTSTFPIIRSMGCNTSLSTSRLKSRAPMARTITTNIVCTTLRTASHSINMRVSNTKTNWPSMYL